jgi:pyruvate kinase
VSARKNNTKIVCTIGPSSSSKQMLLRLARAGMSVARLNLSYGPVEKQMAILRRIRSISSLTGIPIGVLADLPGPKIRVGKVSPEPLELHGGSYLTLTSRRIVGNPEVVSITHPSALRELDNGDPVFLADGTIRLTVERVARGEVVCRVTRGGVLFSGKGVNLPSVQLGLRTLTPKDLSMLRVALKNRVDFVGLSFTANAEDIIRAKRIVRQAGRQAWIIAKVERKQAVRNFREIIREADGAMVARGDLGVEMGIDGIPLLQKDIIKKASAAGKPVITATQMLESMVNSPTPTRAEVTDIANAIMDGTDAVMLSEETAVGKYPIEAVRVMKRVAAATEKALPYRTLLDAKRNLVKAIVQEAISFSASDIAYGLGASCIVAHTRTGLTARRVSRYRPSVPIVALAHSQPVANQLCLLWGVYPRQVKKLRTTAQIFAEAKAAARVAGIASKGDKIVVVCGDPSTPSGTTDLLRVQTA